MPDQTHHPDYADDSVVNVETHHEESDVDVRGLLWFTVAFIVFAILTHVALWLLFRFFVQIERGNANAPLTAMAQSPEANVPASPRLQPFPTKAATEVAPPYRSTPVTDMDEMRAHEEQVLNNYGWVDRDHGIVYIPIEQAKQLALQSNVYQVNTAGAGGAVASGRPTESNGGDVPAGALPAQQTPAGASGGVAAGKTQAGSTPMTGTAAAAPSTTAAGTSTTGTQQ